MRTFSTVIKGDEEAWSDVDELEVSYRGIISARVHPLRLLGYRGQSALASAALVSAWDGAGFGAEAETTVRYFDEQFG